MTKQKQQRAAISKGLLCWLGISIVVYLLMPYEPTRTDRVVLVVAVGAALLGMKR